MFKSAALLALVCLFGLVLASVHASALAISREKRSTLTEEAERMIRQGSNVNTNDVGQLADLVARNKADDCLARVICELTQNPKSHGDAGAKFAQSLLKFRQSKHPKAKKYQDAMNQGAKAKSADQCKSVYSSCNGHSTAEVVAVGNKILK